MYKQAEYRVEGVLKALIDYEPFTGRPIVPGDKVKIVTQKATRHITVQYASRYGDVYYLDGVSAYYGPCSWRQDMDGGHVELETGDYEGSRIKNIWTLDGEDFYLRTWMGVSVVSLESLKASAITNAGTIEGRIFSEFLERLGK